MDNLTDGGGITNSCQARDEIVRFLMFLSKPGKDRKQSTATGSGPHYKPHPLARLKLINM